MNIIIIFNYIILKYLYLEHGNVYRKNKNCNYVFFSKTFLVLQSDPWTVLWLDLANAYGTVPHKLVDLTLKKYHVPERAQPMLKHYFDNFKMRFTVSDYTTFGNALK